MKIVIKNYEVEAFAEFLDGLVLKGKETRMRSRFIKVLVDQLELINREKEQMVNDYSKKDEKGEPVKESGKDGKEYIIIADTASYNHQITKIMQEELIVEVNESNKDIYLTMKEVLLNLEAEFSGFEAQRYDRFCTILEDM